MRKAGISVVLLLTFFYLLPLSANAQKNLTLATVEVLPKEMQVKLTFSGSKADSIIFKTSNEAGQPDFHKNLSQLKAFTKNGRSLKIKHLGEKEWVVYNRKQSVTITYVVTSPKKNFMGDQEGSNFHPTLLENFFFAWGNFLLIPQEKQLAEQQVKLKVKAKAFNKLFVSGKSFPNFNDFVNVLLVGGDVRHYEHSLHNKPVHYIMHGSFAFADTAFVRIVTKVLEAQINYMGINVQQEPLLVTLTEGEPGNYGGTVVKNAISVYPDKSQPLEANKYDIIRLIAHENFHLWNGQHAITADPATPEGYYKWFSEGFTEYYANLTLYRECFYTNKAFIDWVNQSILKYAANPYSLTGTPELMQKEYWTNSSLRNAAYNKGALLGLLFDLKIKHLTNGEKDLDDLMRLLIKRSQPYNDEEMLKALKELTRHDWGDFYSNYVLGTSKLPFEDVFRETQLKAVIGLHPVFDIGFSTASGALGLKDVISTVAVGSNADKAGVKTGDIVMGYSIQWDNTEQDATFLVERNGKKMKFIYKPAKHTEIIQLADSENSKAIELLKQRALL